MVRNSPDGFRGSAALEVRVRFGWPRSRSARLTCIVGRDSTGLRNARAARPGEVVRRGGCPGRAFLGSRPTAGRIEDAVFLLELQVSEASHRLWRQRGLGRLLEKSAVSRHRLVDPIRDLDFSKIRFAFSQIGQSDAVRTRLASQERSCDEAQRRPDCDRRASRARGRRAPCVSALAGIEYGRHGQSPSVTTLLEARS